MPRAGHRGGGGLGHRVAGQRGPGPAGRSHPARPDHPPAAAVRRRSARLRAAQRGAGRASHPLTGGPPRVRADTPAPPGLLSARPGSRVQDGSRVGGEPDGRPARPDHLRWAAGRRWSRPRRRRRGRCGPRPRGSRQQPGSAVGAPTAASSASIRSRAPGPAPARQVHDDLVRPDRGRGRDRLADAVGRDARIEDEAVGELAGQGQRLRPARADQQRRDRRRRPVQGDAVQAHVLRR